MLTSEQIKELRKPLEPKHIKQRDQRGVKLSYIEGWHAIAEANEIFGFGDWSRRTVECKCVYEGPYVTSKGKESFRCTYVAKVEIAVNGTIREGTGSGHGYADNPGEAHESAVKEAETDAMKRALMTFGNRFGLALYDKEQKGVAEEPYRLVDAHGEVTEHTTARDFAGGLYSLLSASKSEDEMKGHISQNKASMDRLKKDAPDLAVGLRNDYSEIVAKLKTPAIDLMNESGEKVLSTSDLMRWLSRLQAEIDQATEPAFVIAHNADGIKAWKKASGEAEALLAPIIASQKAAAE